MSTLKTNTTAARIALLAKNNEKIFHILDLANLWLVKNGNTLRVMLKRYVDQKLIYRIYRGFYSLVPPDQLNQLLIGSKAIHAFCYLSTETVLFQEGYIMQKVNQHTFISEKSLKFKANGNDFRSRKLKTKFLYNSEGIVTENGMKIASINRAICDMLYFNPKYHFDHPVNWSEIERMQKKIGYPLTQNRYDSAKKN